MERVPPPYCDDCLVPMAVRHLPVESPSLVDLRPRHPSGYRAGDGYFDLSQCSERRLVVCEGDLHTLWRGSGLDLR